MSHLLDLQRLLLWKLLLQRLDKSRVGANGGPVMPQNINDAVESRKEISHGLVSALPEGVETRMRIVEREENVPLPLARTDARSLE